MTEGSTKITKYLFAASMAANLVLVAMITRGSALGPSQSLAAEGGVSSFSPNTESSVPAQSPVQPFSYAESSRAGTFWSNLPTHDLEQVVKRLRDAGFPSDAVSAIARVLVAEQANAHREDVLGAPEATPYWRLGGNDLHLTREQNMELSRRLGADQKTLQGLLGMTEMLRHDESLSAYARKMFGDLPIETLASLMRIQTDYGEILRELHEAGNQPPDVLMGKLAVVESEFQRDIKAALTPEEYEQYQLRSGPTATSLRARLDPFQPTEQEFKILHALHEAVRSQFPRNSTDEKTIRAQHEAMDALNSQIEAALGPERYADYKQTLQDSSRQVNNLLVRLDLPLRTGAQIEDLRLDYTARAEAVRNEVQLPPAERDARLNALAQEARQRIGQTLGSTDAVAAYEDIKGWIRDLQPRAAP